MTTGTNIEQALRLSELGWKVFALGPTGFPFPNCRGCAETCVTPTDYDRCDHLICHGCYAGTTEVDRIKAMWEHLPHGLVGVRTGRPSNLFVLDFDLHTADKNGKTGYARLIEQGLLRRSPSARTGGGGRHLYYRHPLDVDIPNNNRGKLGLGVDVKGEGGYVVAPTSAKRGKPPYLWVPGLEPWNIALSVAPLELVMAITKSDHKPVKFSGSGTTQRDEERVLEKWNEALEALDSITVGSRNESLYLAACRGGEMIATGQLTDQQVIDLLEEAGQGMRLTPGEIRQTIRSGLGRGHHDFVQEDK